MITLYKKAEENKPGSVLFIMNSIIIYLKLLLPITFSNLPVAKSIGVHGYYLILLQMRFALPLLSLKMR